MFTLRKVSQDGSISNTYLGDYYMTVRESTSPEKFAELLETASKSRDIVEGTVYAFIITRGYAEIHAIHDDFDYYIVNEWGATFEREYRRK